MSSLSTRWFGFTSNKTHERDFMKLKGRTILITGGSAGIGLAFALKFLELGNEVAVTGRSQTALDEVKAKYPKLHTIQSDVADTAQIAALAKRTKAGFPKLDVLMNNAGIMLCKNLKFPAAEPAGLTAELQINVGGASVITTDELVKQSFSSLKSGALEIRPGQTKQLALMRRLAPNFINRQLWKASRKLVPVGVR